MFSEPDHNVKTLPSVMTNRNKSLEKTVFLWGCGVLGSSSTFVAFYLVEFRTVSRFQLSLQRNLLFITDLTGEYGRRHETAKLRDL